MKKALKITGIVLGAVILLISLGAATIYFEGVPNYEVKAPNLEIKADTAMLLRGEKLVYLICADCHINSQTKKLTGRQLLDLPPDFGEVHSANITRDATYGIGDYTDGELAFLLRTGIKKDGQFTPPYMPKFPHLSDYDLHSIIAYLKSDAPCVIAAPVEDPACKPSFLTKFLCYVAFKPIPYPEAVIEAPDTSDTVAYGEYLVTGAVDCYSCHSADFKTNNIMEPTKSEGYLGGGNTLMTKSQEKILSPNITMDTETGIGNWTEEEFAMAIQSGIRKNAPPLTDAMPRYTLLTDSEIHAIWEYLHTVPPIKNRVERGILATSK